MVGKRWPRSRRTGAWVLRLSALLISQALPAQSAASSRWLYLWTAGLDSTRADALAVVDLTPTATGAYGRVVRRVPVPGVRNVPHHTEHQLSGDGTLFANGFGSGQSWIFDLTVPGAPRVARQFGDVQGMMHPHSFVRLPNGHVLATFQMRHTPAGTRPGGLAELAPDGRVVRTARADAAGVDPRVRPYSAAILPAIDRVFTTTTDMDGTEEINAVQLWRLSDLRLLSTFNLPNGPRGNEGALTAEPRLLPDGQSLLVSTFNCGLYHVTGLTAARPTARLVASFPQKPETSCAIPAIVGRYYLVTVPAWSAVVSLDISDPTHPREVSRVAFGADDVPHWLSVEPNSQRVVVTGYRTMQQRVAMLTFDARTGRLALDTRFGTRGLLTIDGVPHGAVFGRP